MNTMFKVPKWQTIFKIRIIYKSGYAHDIEVLKFTIKPGDSAEWIEASQEHKPIFIGFDDIAAVYQIGYRKTLKWF